MIFIDLFGIPHAKKIYILEYVSSQNIISPFLCADFQLKRFLQLTKCLVWCTFWCRCRFVLLCRYGKFWSDQNLKKGGERKEGRKGKLIFVNFGENRGRTDSDHAKTTCQWRNPASRGLGYGPGLRREVLFYWSPHQTNDLDWSKRQVKKCYFTYSHPQLELNWIHLFIYSMRKNGATRTHSCIDNNVMLFSNWHKSCATLSRVWYA